MRRARRGTAGALSRQAGRGPPADRRAAVATCLPASRKARYEAMLAPSWQCWPRGAPFRGESQSKPDRGRAHTNHGAAVAREASPGFSESGAEARAVGARRRARKRVLASSTAGGRGQQVAETASLCSLCAPRSVRPSTSRDACLKSAHPDSQRQFCSFLFLLKT
ncbi:hypothetical protein VULLAG_LOCUS22731 [Vulpes lagopus]|uniref:uncharacterized protein LOC121497509 isoform X1 n=1 Tax=Vulpes lagopus TaxID=494514 RepID=UPI001BCA268F|nr:uncharacterized protein LOC121497509 isoform X1 [Vulpes lagopus]